MSFFLGTLLLLIFQEVIGTQISTRPRSYENVKQTWMTYGSNPQIQAYVIDKCPLNLTGPAVVRSKCELEDISAPLMPAPSTDTKKGVTFKNRYCAECNRAPPETLVTWLIYLYCNDLHASTINESFAWNHLVYRGDLWTVQNKDRFHSRLLRFDKPSRLDPKVSRCRVGGMSSCLPSSRRNVVGKACALCNLFRAKHLTSETSHCDVCRGQVDANEICDQERPRRMPFSFALLLDVNRSDRDVVGEVRRCRIGEKYDPFFKKCRKLVCAIPGYKIVGGKCIRPR